MKQRQHKIRGKSKGLMCTFLALSCSVGVTGAYADEVADANASGAQVKSLEIREQVLKQIDALFVEMTIALEDGQLTKARQMENGILAQLKNLEGPYGELKSSLVKDRIAQVKARSARVLVDKASKMIAKGEFEKGRTYAQAATNALRNKDEYGVEHIVNASILTTAKNLIDKAEDKMQRREHQELTKITNEGMIPDFEEREDSIEVLLQEAKTLIKASKYTEAVTALERILVLDVYNVDAMRMLERTYDEMKKAAKQRTDLEINQAMINVETGWNQPVTHPEEPVAVSTPKTLQNRGFEISSKLKSIVLDTVEFEDVDVKTACKYLSDRSKELDPAKTGVAIVVSSNLQADAAKKLISMSFDQIPLNEALRYLSQKIGVGYTIVESGVILGEVALDIETRAIKVRPQLIAQISTNAPEVEKSADDSFDLSGDDATASKDSEEAAAGRVSNKAIKAYFAERGIEFPEGSRIAYSPAANKLFVSNTAENILKLEDLIRQIDIQVPMVMIETKILEITEEDLEDLGFQWNIEDLQDPTKPSETTLSGGLDYYRGSESGLSNKTNSTTDDQLAVAPLVEGLNIFPNFGDDDRYAMEVSIIALDESKRAELLSTPKVVTSSGETAKIRMVEERYLPSSWDAPTVDASLLIQPSPQIAAVTPIGIEMEVTPTVSNNYTVSMEISAKVIDFKSFRDFEYKIFTDGETVNTGQVRMPITNRREIKVNMKVYDGETVILGGYVQEDKRSLIEKNPFLGDIPLVGRFFNREGEETVKKNLLMLVTARLIGGNGEPVRRNVTSGVPDFR